MSQTPPHAQRILIAGDSASARVLALARALAPPGRMICIDGDRDAARRASAALAREGLGDRVHVIVGDPALFVRKVAGPFDRIVIVADGDARARIAAHLPRLAAPECRVQYGWDD